MFGAYSAGTEIKGTINPDAVRVVQKIYGIDMTEDQHPKLLSELPPVDIVVTMGCGVQCPYLPCKHREDWGLDDPTGKTEDEGRQNFGLPSLFLCLSVEFLFMEVFDPFLFNFLSVSSSDKKIAQISKKGICAISFHGGGERVKSDFINGMLVLSLNFVRNQYSLSKFFCAAWHKCIGKAFKRENSVASIRNVPCQRSGTDTFFNQVFSKPQ